MRLLNSNEMDLVSGGLTYDEEARQAMQASGYVYDMQSMAQAGNAAMNQAIQAAKNAAAAAAAAATAAMNSAASYYASLTSSSQVGVTVNACVTVQSGNITSQTCQNSDGTTSTQVCTNYGPSAIVNGSGAALTLSGCVTVSTK